MYKVNIIFLDIHAHCRTTKTANVDDKQLVSIVKQCAAGVVIKEVDKKNHITWLWKAEDVTSKDITASKLIHQIKQQIKSS